MIWTRFKRWLATHPLWCLLVGSSVSFTIVLVPLWIVGAVIVKMGVGRLVGPLVLVAVMTGLWLLLSGAVAFGYGVLAAKSGLSIAAVRRRWLWIWLGLVPLWLPLAAGALAWLLAGNVWVGPIGGLVVSLILSAMGVAFILGGLSKAEDRARRQFASGRWTVVAAVTPEQLGGEAVARQKVDRRTTAWLAIVTAVLAYVCVPVLAALYLHSAPASDSADDINALSLIALAAGYILLVVALAIRRGQARLTNTDLLWIGAAWPWLLMPVFGTALMVAEMVQPWHDDLAMAFWFLAVFAAMGYVLVGAWILTLLVLSVVWVGRWIRDPRYRRSAMKEFDQ